MPTERSNNSKFLLSVITQFTALISNPRCCSLLTVIFHIYFHFHFPLCVDFFSIIFSNSHLTFTTSLALKRQAVQRKRKYQHNSSIVSVYCSNNFTALQRCHFVRQKFTTVMRLLPCKLAAPSAALPAVWHCLPQLL